MTDRSETAAHTAANLRDFSSRLANAPVLVGFDGFVDAIIDVVGTRHDAQQYHPVPTITEMGRKISEAAGQSSNYELVPKIEKLGGNGPIMAYALASLSAPTTYLGALGHPTLHPVFEDLAQRATCLSFSEPGYTDALEFSDGKIMLGKHTPLRNVNWEQLCEVIGRDRIIDVLTRSHLIGMVNWTMLTRLGEIFDHLARDLLPDLPPLPGGRRRRLFIDLADPEKRTEHDIRRVLGQITAFEQHAEVALGLNLKEAGEIAAVLDVPTSADPEAAIEDTARSIREQLGVSQVVIHPRGGAAAAALVGGAASSARFDGPFVHAPRISTGAGDHFNAGFCLGLLADLPLEQSLCAGVGTSGYYVRHAASPTLQQLAEFCENLPDPEPV